MSRQRREQRHAELIAALRVLHGEERLYVTLNEQFVQSLAFLGVMFIVLIGDDMLARVLAAVLGLLAGCGALWLVHRVVRAQLSQTDVVESLIQTGRMPARAELPAGADALDADGEVVPGGPGALSAQINAFSEQLARRWGTNWTDKALFGLVIGFALLAAVPHFYPSVLLVQSGDVLMYLFFFGWSFSSLWDGRGRMAAGVLHRELVQQLAFELGVPTGEVLAPRPDLAARFAQRLGRAGAWTSFGLLLFVVAQITLLMQLIVLSMLEVSLAWMLPSLALLGLGGWAVLRVARVYRHNVRAALEESSLALEIADGRTALPHPDWLPRFAPTARRIEDVAYDVALHLPRHVRTRGLPAAHYWLAYYAAALAVVYALWLLLPYWGREELSLWSWIGLNFGVLSLPPALAWFRRTIHAEELARYLAH